MVKPPEHYFLVAGEKSGDHHAAALVMELRRLQPDAYFSGIAGSDMRLAGVEPLFNAEALAVMGFSDVIPALPRLISIFRAVRHAILSQNPTAVIFVDYPGFNLRLAASLRRAGYQGRLIHYISPAVWVWGAKRKTAMANHLDLLMVIYPFEKQLFSNTGLRVEYVGNPLVEAIDLHVGLDSWKALHNIPDDVPLVGLFPGSRLAEIKRNLPLMLEACKGLDYPLAISAADFACEELIKTLVRPNERFHIARRNEGYFSLMRDCSAAVAKSGTVTLELALSGCPTVVTYAVTRLNRFLARFLIESPLPYYCIVNILAQRELFPEFIERSATPLDLQNSLRELLKNEEARHLCLEGCSAIRNELGSLKSSFKAAELIAEFK